MYVDGMWLKDSDGRTRILRGANLGGSTKVPFTPDGATYRSEGFFDSHSVSFVGRPFPLAEADEHFRRLRAWGMTFLRFLVTWEAIEHAGPGIYDTDYLDYVVAVIKKAAEYGIEVFIDPHQDVWSRWTGGDGAPGWTLEAVGIDLSKLNEVGGAISHQTHGDPFPRMIWPSNYGKFGAATMFALFFAGNDFAPATKIDGVPVQDYLQGHYIESIKQVAQRLKDLPNVVGYDSLNEPVAQWIGQKDITTLSENAMMLSGVTLTPLQAMAAAAGYTVEAAVYELGFNGPKVTAQTQVNPDGVRLWRDGFPDLWQENGVWTGDGGDIQPLHSEHFATTKGHPADFVHDYLKPFIARFADGIRSVDPDAIIFVEGVPGGAHGDWGADNPPQTVNAGHWYDVITLVMKHFSPDFTMDFFTNQPVNGAENVGAAFAKQLGGLKTESLEHMGGIPTLVGEFGIPFDLDNKQAYRDGDFSQHIQALDMYYDAMDASLLSCTIWNYTADNSNERGDLWNDEDLSIFSRDQQDDPNNIHSGGRALEGIVRPYAQRTAGEPLRMSFERDTRTFEFEYRHDPAVSAPTEIFVPGFQYPRGGVVEVSDGTYTFDHETQILTYRHTSDRPTHSIKVTPRPS
ncbi:MAG: cellulase family glycosylhydrolase [Chloroflexota bacterium]